MHELFPIDFDFEEFSCKGLSEDKAYFEKVK